MPISKQQLAQILSGNARELCNPDSDKMFDNIVKRKTDRTVAINENFPNVKPNKITNEQINSSNLPKEIKDSFIKEQYDDYFGESVLSGMDLIPKYQPKSKINEEKVNQSSASSIDYSLIRAIVNDCIKENMKDRIDEGKNLSSVILKEGKIQLIDNSGNIYIAKLQKKGNIND